MKVYPCFNRFIHVLMKVYPCFILSIILTGLCAEKFFDLFLMSRKKIFPPPPPRLATFLGKIVARNKNLLQGIIGFGRAILADTPPIKRA
jgi:hypothetical protein